ncbi:MAG: DNA-binding transcriptional LysR family regulator [Reinekea sp.]|jgi:DNA-binding transcriptional LysR family regulator
MRFPYQSKFELKHLRALVAVGEELNFHRAADRLRISQPAVSRLIKELENRIEAILVDRTTRKVTLTRAGEFFSNEARDILRHAEMAETTARSYSEGVNSLLRIAYMNLAGHALVPDIVQRFSDKHPSVRCELSYLTSPLQRVKVENGDIDLGFIVGPFQSNEISSKVVAQHPLMVLLPGTHPLASKTELTVHDLAGVPLILGTVEEWPTLRSIIDDVFDSDCVKLSICQEASSLTGILGLVTNGLAPTIFCGVPRFCVEPAIIARRLVSNKVQYVASNMIWRKRGMTISLRKFIETAEEVSKDYLVNYVP